MCPCNDKKEKYRKEKNERKARCKLEEERKIQEAKERLAKKKLEEGMCLDLDDIEHIDKKERIKMAKHLCDKEFR